MTRISCIIPVWNCETYISAAIESVKNQTRPVDEIIVVDDGSTDGTAGVLAGISGITVVTQTNQGASAARNLGITSSTGDLICFNDADDLWMPEKTERQLAAMMASPELDMVFGMIEHRIVEGSAAARNDQISLPQGIVEGRLIQNMLAKRSVFETVGLFEASKSTTVEQEWLLKAREAGLAEFLVPDLTSVRQVHGDNMTLRLATEKRSEYNDMLMKILRERRQAGKTVKPTWDTGKDG